MIARDIPLYKVHMPDSVDQPLRDCLHSGSLSNGPCVAEFENLFAQFIGNPHLITTSDSSNSITLALMMSGVGVGDEVLASPMGCLASTMPVLQRGAQVRWVDVDPASGNLSLEDLKKQITPRAKALLVYHWVGNPVELKEIYSICSAHNIKVIEDAGEALGATYDGNYLGNTGSDFTIFSFSAVRHLNTIEGAAISFKSPQEFERGKWMRRYGIHQPSFRDPMGEINPSSDILQPGLHAYMNNISAQVGMVQMTHLQRLLKGFQENGAYYDEALAGLPKVSLLKRVAKSQSAHWVYSFLTRERDLLLAKLRIAGVAASKVHLRNDAYSCFGKKQRELPGVDSFEARQLSIPCGWWVSPQDRQSIVANIKMGLS